MRAVKHDNLKFLAITWGLIVSLVTVGCSDVDVENISSQEFNNQMIELSKTMTDLETSKQLSLAIKVPSKANVINAVLSVGANKLSRSETDMNICLSKSIALSSISLSSSLELIAVGGPITVNHSNTNQKYMNYVNELTKNIASKESSKAQDSFNQSAKLGLEMVLGTKDKKSILHDWLACSRSFKNSSDQLKN